MSAVAQDDGMRAGKCTWCEERTRIFRDNRLCESCDNEVRYCTICKCLRHRDDKCRHIYENRWFEWRGAGICIDDDVKGPLFKMFDLMPVEFPADLRAAIKSKRFHTWFVAPLIGGGGCLSFYGMPKRDTDVFDVLGNSYGDRMIELGERDDAEETADGYHWLASLFDGDTAKANKATIRWIDEYLAAKAETQP